MAPSTRLSGQADSAEGEPEQLWQEAEPEDHPGHGDGQGRPSQRRVRGEANAFPDRWGMIGCSHAFSLTMEMQMPVRSKPSRWLRTTAALILVAAVGACSEEQPGLTDLPPDVAQARPSISAEEARFVLVARERGAFVTGATVDDDIETGTTVCWALQNGATLQEIAVDDQDQPLGNEGDELRTKQLMAAAVDALCPDYADQVPQLNLP